MRYDLIGERDRFIPGWYGETFQVPTRTEWTTPEWRWPVRLQTVLAKLALSLPTPFQVRFRQRRELGATCAELVQTAGGSSAML